MYDDNIPKPKWTWYFQASKTDPFEKINIGPVFSVNSKGSLIIKHVDTKHVGRYLGYRIISFIIHLIILFSYKCQVTSISGNDSKTADLIVIETPTLSIEKSELLQEKFVNITWKIIFDGNSQVQTISIQAQRIAVEGM